MDQQDRAAEDLGIFLVGMIVLAFAVLWMARGMFQEWDTDHGPPARSGHYWEVMEPR